MTTLTIVVLIVLAIFAVRIIIGAAGDVLKLIGSILGLVVIAAVAWVITGHKLPTQGEVKDTAKKAQQQITPDKTVTKVVVFVKRDGNVIVSRHHTRYAISKATPVSLNKKVTCAVAKRSGKADKVLVCHDG